MYKLLTAILVFVLVTSSCGGSNTPPPTPPALVPAVGSGNLGNANNARLVPADNPGIAGVGGEFLVQDFTILDENKNVVGPSLGGTKLLGRLVDPGDDILSETIPGLNGKYELLTNEPVTNAKVRLEFWVQEDVDGDGQGNDLVVHTVPVQLVPGFISQLNITIKKGSVHDVSPVFDENTPSPPGLAESASVVVGVERLDGNGEYGEFFALLPDGSLYVDDNNDEFIEPGVDSLLGDLDRNGWADLEEADYQDSGILSWTYLEGTVLSVDTAAQTMFLFVEFAETIGPGGIPLHDPSLVGKSVQVRKLSYTVMEGLLLPLDPDMDGLASPDDIGFTDSFLIDDSLVGRTVVVQGVYDGEFMDSEVIFELSHEPALPSTEF